MRLIDADALKEYLGICECCDKCPNKKLNCNADCTLPDFLTDDWERIINEQPTVPPHPQRMRGRWTEKHHAYSDEESVIEEWQSCRCSECGRYDTRPYMYYFSEPNYCSYCGADMRGEQDE